MNRLFEAIKRIYIFLFFILLELFAYNIYRNSSLYVSGETHNASNKLLGGVYAFQANLRSYFSLKEENEELVIRNSYLAQRVSVLENVNLRLLRGEKMDTLSEEQLLVVDSLSVDTVGILSNDSLRVIAAKTIAKDRYISARVINNSVALKRNNITLDRGTRDSVEVDMPVVFNDNVVGYVVSVGENFSIARSLLSIDFKISAMLSKDASLCSVYWDGHSPYEANFSGISRYSELNVGDTIITTGFSRFFTSDKMIGVVKEFELSDDIYYKGKITLFTNFVKLRNVDIIFPDKLRERLELENREEK